MALIDPINGHYVTLRCVEPSDAEFTLAIRNNEELTKYIPKVNGTLDTQRKWIENQQKKAGDYFFIIQKNNGSPAGTISFYDVDPSTGVCELGRYISLGNALENVEAAVMLVDYIFQEAGLKKIILHSDENNKKIMNFWIKMGAVFEHNVEMDGWTASRYGLTPELYKEKRPKVVKLLKI